MIPRCESCGAVLDSQKRCPNAKANRCVGASLTEAESIVRSLAEGKWVYDYICCFFCGATAIGVEKSGHGHLEDGEQHDAECVYGQALCWTRVPAS